MSTIFKEDKRTASKKFSNYDNDDDRKDLETISDEHEITLLDAAFQRYGGNEFGSGWSLKDQRNFIRNLLDGKVGNDITRIHVDECLRYAQYIECEESIKYFTKAKEEGFIFVSVDGNNTSSAIWAFRNNKLLIDSLDGGLVSYSQIGQKQQKKFDKLCFTVNTLRKISHPEIFPLFVDLQKHRVLQPQEVRNATNTPLARYIREMANTLKRPKNLRRNIPEGMAYPTGTKWFNNAVFPKKTDDNLAERKHEMMMAKICAKIESGYTAKVTSVGLDEFYSSFENLKPKTKDRIQEISNVLDKVAGGEKRKKSLGCLPNSPLVFIDFVNLLLEAGYKIKKPVNLEEIFLSWEKDEIIKSEGLSNTKEDKKKSYVEQQAYAQQPEKYCRILEMLRDGIIKDDKKIKDMENEGVIKKLAKRTKKDSFSRLQKLKLIGLQGGKTRDGEDISIRGVLEGEFEADHRVSVANGGQTTIENAELMFRSKNRKKGSKSNEPHFDYQK